MSGKETDWSKFKTARKQLSKNLKRARDTYLSGYLTDTMQENPFGPILRDYDKTTQALKILKWIMNSLVMPV